MLGIPFDTREGHGPCLISFSIWIASTPKWMASDWLGYIVPNWYAIALRAAAINWGNHPIQDPSLGFLVKIGTFPYPVFRETGFKDDGLVKSF